MSPLRRFLLALLRQAGRGLEHPLLALRLGLDRWRLERRLARLERLQRTLRGRLVAACAAAETARRRGDEEESADRERDALQASLIRITRALAEGRTEAAALRQARVSAASSLATAALAGRSVALSGATLAEGEGRFDTPRWAARRRLGAGARTRATLAALRAGSPFLESHLDPAQEAAEPLLELRGLGEP
ncbi:MAG: hypothetical protein P1V51_24915 [Deltaproteobacteria bacterium]|nr:hypothetical protein [Deltaproteobacteria bacterium]